MSVRRRLALLATALVAPLAGCAGADGGAGDGQPSTVTVEDARGDTWKEGPGGTPTGKPSDVAVNVDLTSLTATYDETGIVFEVQYAEPLDLAAAGGYDLVINFDYGMRQDGDDKALLWWSGKPHQAESANVDYYEFRCRPEVSPEPAAGRLTFTYPAGGGCLPKNSLPEQVRVRYVTASGGSAADQLFTERERVVEGSARVALS